MAGSALAKPLMLTQVLWLKTEWNQVILGELQWLAHIAA